MTIKDGNVDLRNKTGSGPGGGWLSLSGEYYVDLDAGAKKKRR